MNSEYHNLLYWGTKQALYFRRDHVLGERALRSALPHGKNHTGPLDHGLKQNSDQLAHEAITALILALQLYPTDLTCQNPVCFTDNMF